MANPVSVLIPQRQWTLVASGVTSGRINRGQTNYDYYQTYRLSGNEAPVDPVDRKIPEEAVKVFESATQAMISSSRAIDVYFFCVSRDGGVLADGQVRVDV